jgi:hypothetical protein
MEDDKTPGTPRKRAAKAKPTDTSNPSVAGEPTPTGTGRPARPRKVPPATFVQPGGPSQQTASNDQAATPRREGPEPPRKVAKKAAKKAAPKAIPMKATTAAAPAAATPRQEISQPAETPTPAPAPAPARQAVPLAALWPIIKANPGYATELVTLAAVEHLGPRARQHLTWLRDTYPTATVNGLARIAASRSVRLARTQGAVTGLLGPLAMLAGTGTLLWTQTRLVLDIAALHGRDPADPERAAELLVLQRVHPDLATARQAITAARAAAADASGTDEAGDLPLPLLRLAGRALTRITLARQAARFVPGAGAALTGILDGRATEQLAVRAAKFYRG